MITFSGIIFGGKNIGMDVTFLNGALYSANVARRIIGDNAFSFYDRAQLYRSLD